MKWSTGIAVLFFFVLVVVVANPQIVDDVALPLRVQEKSVIVPPQPPVTTAQAGSTSVEPEPTATPRSVPKSQLTIDDLRLIALSYINKDRADHGLPPVTLGTNQAAQDHAEDMLEGRYLGHWWRDGSKPYMVYSQLGGTSYVSENAARTGFSFAEYARHCNAPLVRCQKVDPVEDIKRLEYAMMYDDAESDWGHRDNILGASHRKVNIGIAYSDHFLAFVQHFEGGTVTALMPPTIEGGVLTLSAIVNEPGFRLFSVVTVHREDLPQPRTIEEIEMLRSYCVGGGFSESCGPASIRVIPPPAWGRRYGNLGTDTVAADRWSFNSQGFTIVADLGSRARQPGVYTITAYEDTGSNFSGDAVLQLSVVVGGVQGVYAAAARDDSGA